MRRICVAGNGAWGKALAHVARQAGHDVRIWSRGDAAISGDVDAVILAVPAQALREACKSMALCGGAAIIAAKGIEQGSGKFMAEVVADVAPQAQAMVLSGPSFADDVMQEMPTAVVLAGPSIEMAVDWAGQLSLQHFRIYQSNDVKGVEIGGALKNVLAIACGIADGRGLGASARAALITRGFAELSRLGRKLGARAETLHGLSGLGDLLLTCSSAQSRNYAFGFRIGGGMAAPDSLAASRGVVEGAATCSAAVELAKQTGVDMPIALGVHAIINQSANPGDIIRSLLARPATTEFDEEN